jgi:hypothetical protein
MALNEYRYFTPDYVNAFSYLELLVMLKSIVVIVERV